MEVAAENLRKIERGLLEIGDFNKKRVEIERVDRIRKDVFGDATDTDIENDLKKRYLLYCKKPAVIEAPAKLILETLAALQVKINQQSVEQKRYAYFLELSKLDIEASLSRIEASAIKLGESAQPLIEEKLNVLKAAIAYSEKNIEEEIKCPACGRVIPSASFSAHVKEEESSLKEAVSNYDLYIIDISELCTKLQSLKRILSQDQIHEWKAKRDEVAISHVESLKIDSIRSSFTSEIHNEINNYILPIIEAAKNEVTDPLVDVSKMMTDKEQLETIQQMMKVARLRVEVNRTEGLIALIATIQKLYREQIRVQATAVVDTISTNIARMWGVLHPDKKVEDVRLCLPDDVDKAIEIGLKFYGVDQDSPRLTLSEGHRNSLGLCIFLSMAKKETNSPVILDDVVVSFDRGHRGMVGILLEKEFFDRQIILLTHERDWYIDLKAQLDQKRWEFKTLMPWVSPEIGIRFSTKQFAFDDARAFLPSDPKSAGNIARTIMDISTAVLAESLKICLPYLHRERNDHRTGHEFLSKIASMSTAFQIKRDGINYEPFTEALEDIKTADRLIVSWANNASHDFNIVDKEASMLIDACEKSLAGFMCTSCGKSVADMNNEKSCFKSCGPQFPWTPNCGIVKVPRRCQNGRGRESDAAGSPRSRDLGWAQG